MSDTTRGARLLPNLGAEEPGDWRRNLRQPQVWATAQLWRWLFGPGSAFASRGPDAAPHAHWPDALGPPPEAPVFDWLEDAAAGVPWLATREALAAPELQPISRGCPDPDAVRRVHDKAFAHRVSLRSGLVPRELRELTSVFEPDAATEADATLRQIRDRVEAWPAWTRGRFTIKPRFGSSGRGRLGGVVRDLETAALSAGLVRMAQRGGALLEPWLDRCTDLSVQLRIAPDGAILLLGTLCQQLSPSGVPAGHRGIVDSRGRVFSDSPHEEVLREAGAALAGAARDEGFHGVCGIDAFSYRGEAGRLALRPVVEFNARFTLGTIVLGLVRRALPILKSRLGLVPGEHRAFFFSLVPPEGGWDAVRTRAGNEAVLISLLPATGPTEPALLLARTPATLDAALRPSPDQS